MRVEVRSDRVLLDGYVNAVGRDSRVIPDRRGDFVEQVVPGAFGEALSGGKPVGLMLNHQRALGGTATGELELVEDSIGLRAKATVTDPEIIIKARAKELRGWSFGFGNAKDRWEEQEGGPPRRFLEGFELREVSIVDMSKVPAYPATSLEVRDDGETLNEYRASYDKPEYVVTEPDPPTTSAPDGRTTLALATARRLRLSSRK